MNPLLPDRLRKLRLSGLAQSLEVRLQEARASRLEYDEFLALILEDELAVRQDRLISRRIQSAAFRDMKTLEDFDWQFNRSVKKKQIFDRQLVAGSRRATRYVYRHTTSRLPSSVARF